jgi:deoxyribodipyrimidine photolyase-related protein
LGQKLGGGALVLGSLPSRTLTMRHCILILGDQLNRSNPALDGFDITRDRILMIEAPDESTRGWSHRARTVLFLSAMRHFAETLRAEGLPVDYILLDAEDAGGPALADRLQAALRRARPEKLIVSEPGEHALARAITNAAQSAGVPCYTVEDHHFLCSRAEFAQWAHGRRELRMEYFYREMRRRHRILMDGDQPAGGRWNFDADNRGAYPAAGPGAVPPPLRFEPDAITREVIAVVTRCLPDNPGSLSTFAWPVSRGDALRALDGFVEHRLTRFGEFQDAMWTDTPFGWHSLLSAALNLKLLDPREVIARAVSAWERGLAPLAAVEGFVRQILGWREFIRGVYWLDMPALLESNHFGHHRPLPNWFWTGDTDMHCLQQTLKQTLEHGYAHHIQRLMIAGNFALLAGLSPKAVHEWYLAVYVDAVEWAELPNTLGMALFANGGRFTSKPYVASGAYIKRMSNYCRGCRYDPKQKTGARACPYTTLYWNFLDRHEAALARNPRTGLMARNIARLTAAERAAIRATGCHQLARIAPETAIA